MNMREKQSLTAQVSKRYLKAGKKEKGLILDEYLATTGYNRSYARRILGLKAGKYFRKKPGLKVSRSRKRIYGQYLSLYLTDLWKMGNFACGKRLSPVIPEYIFCLERDRVCNFPKNIREKLLTISAATIDRLLTKQRAKFKLKGRSLTKPGTLLKHQIPIRIFTDWDENIPGFFETDTVGFGGGNPAGHYVWGLDMTDIFTGWVLLDAVMGRGQYGIHQAIKQARERLVFKMLGIDCDSGGEFINAILFRYCQENQITLTRSRPGKKNDNCYVEQKNYTALRTFLGYARYETEEQLALVKQILELTEIYINFFQASAKLTSKKRVGARVTKKYDTPQTPYRRLCRSGILAKKQRQRLYQIYCSHNPAELMNKIRKLQKKLDKTCVTKLDEATKAFPLHF